MNRSVDRLRVATEDERHRLGDLIRRVGLGVGCEESSGSFRRVRRENVELGHRRAARDHRLRRLVVRPVRRRVHRAPALDVLVELDEMLPELESVRESRGLVERCVQEDQTARAGGRVRGPVGNERDVAHEEPVRVVRRKPLVVRPDLLDPAGSSGLLIAADDQSDVAGRSVLPGHPPHREEARHHAAAQVVVGSAPVQATVGPQGQGMGRRLPSAQLFGRDRYHIVVGQDED
ncbi:MAG: hypothetical protein L3J86_06240, partial [Thermoplasmata archaeon]|nr:hypothetical protein [Thermoplasmata archaeon]